MSSNSSIHKYLDTSILQSPLLLLSQNWNSKLYLKSILQPITPEVSNQQESEMRWTRIKNQPIQEKHPITATSTSTPSLISFIDILLLRCQLLCGSNKITDLFSSSFSTSSSSSSIDIESENGKEACAILSLFGIISRTFLSVLFPFWDLLENLLENGFIYQFTESRGLCVDIISSLILHLTSLNNVNYSETITTNEVQSMNDEIWTIVHMEKKINVKSEWILNMISHILTCSNDIDSIVSFSNISD